MAGTPADDTPKIAIGAVIFANYTFTSQPKKTDAAGNTISPNSFDVSRTYLNIQGQVSHVVAFRITPDIVREASTGPTVSGSLVFRLKYGFMQLNLDDWTGAFKGSWVRLGIQQTPLIDYVEGIYRYRFQDNTWVEKDLGLKSSDAGASFHTNLPNNYGDVHVGVYNGEGYSAVEANNQKALDFRVSVRPMGRGSLVARGLRVTAYLQKDDVVMNAPRDREVFEGTFEHKHFNAGFDYGMGKDQSLPTSALTNLRGWSVWVNPFLKAKGNGPEVFVRYDDFTPNTSNTSAQRRRAIAGFAYWFPHPGGGQTAALMVDYENTAFPGTVTAKVTAVHLLINY